jgi:hypothetical protein
VSIEKITINVGKQTIEATLEELRELKSDLAALFPDRSPFSPATIPLPQPLLPHPKPPFDSGPFLHDPWSHPPMMQSPKTTHIGCSVTSTC